MYYIVRPFTKWGLYVNISVEENVSLSVGGGGLVSASGVTG